MDPKKCFEMMLDAEFNDATAYLGYKDDLITWFRTGGHGFKAELADGKHVTVTSLNYRGDVSVTYRNGKRTTVRMSEVVS